MNTVVDVIVVTDSPSPPLDAFVSTKLLFEQQEARFSRFRLDSLLCRLNRGETINNLWLATACTMALDAWRFTKGIFNPLVLPALEAAGYDRSFDDVTTGTPAPRPVPSLDSCLAIQGSEVVLNGARMDLGGIVKGWTVDLAVEALRSSYPDALVNAGGDVRSNGSVPGVIGWPMSVAAPDDGPDVWKGTLDGAMATSSVLRRRWRTADGHAHHLIDPRSGLPAQTPFAQATAWASDCSIAECWAKAIVIGGVAALDSCREAGFPALAVLRH